MIKTRKIETLETQKEFILNLYHKSIYGMDNYLYLNRLKNGEWDVYFQYCNVYGISAIIIKNNTFKSNEIIFNHRITIEPGYALINLSEHLNDYYEEDNYIDKLLSFEDCLLSYDLIQHNQRNVGISLNTDYNKEIFVDLKIDENTKETIAIRISQSKNI